VVSRCGRQAGKEAPEVIEVSAFFQFELKVLFREVELREAVLVHEFDDSTDFLEFHGKKRFGVGW
jgi:hypothetical protein